MKALRLEALADAPEAFGERLDVAVAMGGEDFSAALGAGAVWGVFDGERAVGMAGLNRFAATNDAHKATITAVYITPVARGSGAADVLFAALIGHARSVGVEILQLGVGDFNQRAHAFYRRMGFVPFGLERKALKLHGRYIDEVWMALDV